MSFLSNFRQQFVHKIKEQQPDLNESTINKLIPYIVGASIFGLVYIFNAHQAVKKVRAIDKSTQKLKELRAEYISTLSDLSKRSTLTEVLSKTKESGLKGLETPPFVIKVDKKK